MTIKNLCQYVSINVDWMRYKYMRKDAGHHVCMCVCSYCIYAEIIIIPQQHCWYVFYWYIDIVLLGRDYRTLQLKVL